jgi:hypothetical protein
VVETAPDRFPARRAKAGLDLKLPRHRPSIRPYSGVSMSFPRTIVSGVAAIAVTLSLAGPLRATEVSMGNGTVNFHIPDDWVDILDTQGDPEVHVYQVPDPSPTGKLALARVTVTVKTVADMAAFQQYVGKSSAKAMVLTGYKADAAVPRANSYTYSAQESGTQYTYSEHYWMKDGHAVQLRCARPLQSDAGAAWKASFDKNCEAIAAKLK